MTEIKNAEKVIAEAYKELAVYTAKTRSYAGMADGLKTSYRRTLTQTEKYRQFTKSATLVGETMKTHVHGDASIYSVLIMMTCRYGRFPLFRGKGNFGGLSFEASSSRYTEACLTDTARAIYLDLAEFADYGDGEAGNTEALYLPAYLPYCFLAGSSGMTVGLPTPNIPSLSPAELIDFCVAKLKGTEPAYPHLNEGRCVCETPKKDIDAMLRTGQGRLTFRPLIQKESSATVSVCEATPGSSLDKGLSALRRYIDEDTVEFVNETSEKGYRYVFTLCNSSKLTMDQMVGILTKALRSSVTYRIIVEKDGIVHHSSLDEIVDCMLDYLKECARRKFRKLGEEAEARLQVYEAIDGIRKGGLLSRLHTMTLEDMKDALADMGYSSATASEVCRKPLSYLTKEHDSEKGETLACLERYRLYQDNPVAYLEEQYQKLKSLILTEMKGYCTRTLSEEELARYSTRKVILCKDRLYSRKRGGVPLGESGCVLLVTDGCLFCRFSVPSTEEESYDLPEGRHYMCMDSDKGKYFAVLYEDKDGNTCLTVNEARGIRTGADLYIRLREEGFYTPIACLSADSDTVSIKSGDMEIKLSLPEFLCNKRRRYPTVVARRCKGFRFC